MSLGARYHDDYNGRHSSSNLCDFYLFFIMEAHLMERKFTDDEEVICTANSWLENQIFPTESTLYGEMLEQVHISCRTVRWKVSVNQQMFIN